MTNTEWSNYRYHKLQDAGLCPVCGKERDREDRAHCTACREKKNAKQRSQRVKYIEYGICPICKVNPIYDGRKKCFDCTAMARTYRENVRVADREAYNAQARIYNKQNYHKNRELGLCVMCRRKVEEPEKYAKCSICRAKYRQRHAEKMAQRGPVKTQGQIWREQGLCYLCGGELYEDKKLCKRHYDIMHNIGIRNKDYLRGGKREQTLQGSVPGV